MLQSFVPKSRRLQAFALCKALRWGSCGVLLMVATFGCGPPTAAVSDVQQATSLLTSTLDAWKSGATLADQREKSPPVYVVEELWLRGSELKRFELQGPGEVFGTNVCFHVALTCNDGAGSSKPREVTYLVTTTPALTIAREDS